MSDAPLSAIISRFKVSCVEDFVGVGWWLKIAKATAKHGGATWPTVHLRDTLLL